MTFFNGIPPDTTASSSFDGCVVTLMLECLLVKTIVLSKKYVPAKSTTSLCSRFPWSKARCSATASMACCIVL